MNIQYNLGKDCADNKLDFSPEKVYKDTIAPYWYPYVSETEYMKSLFKDCQPLKFTWPI